MLRYRVLCGEQWRPRPSGSERRAHHDVRETDEQHSHCRLRNDPSRCKGSELAEWPLDGGRWGCPLQPSIYLLSGFIPQAQIGETGTTVRTAERPPMPRPRTWRRRHGSTVVVTAVEARAPRPRAGFRKDAKGDGARPRPSPFSNTTRRWTWATD